MEDEIGENYMKSVEEMLESLRTVPMLDLCLLEGRLSLMKNIVDYAITERKIYEKRC